MRLRKLLRKFLEDTGAIAVGAKVAGMLGVIVVLVAGLFMTPIIAYEVDYIIFQNASDWNFTAASGAEALLGLIPFVWVAGLLIMAVASIFVISKSGD